MGLVAPAFETGTEGASNAEGFLAAEAGAGTVGVTGLEELAGVPMADFPAFLRRCCSAQEPEEPEGSATPLEAGVEGLEPRGGILLLLLWC